MENLGLATVLKDISGIAIKRQEERGRRKRPEEGEKDKEGRRKKEGEMRKREEELVGNKRWKGIGYQG